MTTSDLSNFSPEKIKDLVVCLMQVTSWREYRKLVDNHKTVLLSDEAVNWIRVTRARLKSSYPEPSNKNVIRELNLIEKFLTMAREEGIPAAQLRLQSSKKDFTCAGDVEHISSQINEARDFLVSLFGKNTTELKLLLRQNLSYVRSAEFVSICNSFLANASSIPQGNEEKLYIDFIKSLLELSKSA